jgi:hypothetical protein
MIEIFRSQKKPSTIHVYVKAGQSNNLGGNDPPYTPQKADKFVKLYPELTRQLRKLDAYPPRDARAGRRPERIPHDLAPISFGGNLRAGPEITFGRLLFRHYGKRHNTVIAKFAVGGSSLHRHWMAPGPRRLSDRLVRYLKELRRITRANGDTFTVSGFTWVQGEADARRSDDADHYFSNLQALIATVRGFAENDELPVVISRTYIAPANDEEVAGLAKVRQAQEDFVKADRYAALVNLDDLAHDQTGVHFRAEEYARIGEREFYALRSITGGRLRQAFRSIFRTRRNYQA